MPFSLSLKSLRHYSFLLPFFLFFYFSLLPIGTWRDGANTTKMETTFITERIQALLNQNRKVEALSLYCKHFKCTMNEAIGVIEAVSQIV